MNIKNRLKKLEKESDINGFCMCYALTVKDFPKRISTDWLKKDDCDKCGKNVNQNHVKEIFDLYQLADEHLAETEKTYNKRQI